MKQCPNPQCLQFNPDDSALACPYCRTPYAPASRRDKKKDRKKDQTVPDSGIGTTGGRSSSGSGKKAALFAGLAAGAVALAAVIFLVVTSIFGTSALGIAAENSVSALNDQLSGHTNMFSYLEDMEFLSAKSDCHILLGIQTPDVALSLDTDYAGSKKLFNGSVEFQHLHEDFRMGADFHGNKKELRIFGSDLVDTYGFKYSDFEKKYNSSHLRKVLGLPSAESLRLAPFRSFDLKDFLKEQGGSSWDAFEETLEIEKYDTRELTLGSRTEECTIYRVQWDAKKAEKMLKTITRNTLGFLPDFIPELVNKLAPDVRLFVDSNDCLVGVDFTFLNSIYTFLLEGVNNPWEQATLTITSAGGEPIRYSGGVVPDADGVRIELKAQNETVYAIYYNNSTGAYSIVSPKGELSNGIYRADDTGFHLESNFYNFSYVISVSDLTRMPERSDDKYVDLMDLNLSEFNRLITDVCSGFGITTDDLIALIGSLVGG